MNAVIQFWSDLPLLVQTVIKGLAVIGVMFPIGGACSLVERKVSAWMQCRPGPNRAIPFWFAWVPVLGPFLQKLGVFHLMADGGKMFLKEDPVPGHVNKFYFTIAPLVAMIPALTTVVAVPFGAYLDTAGQIVPVVLANLDVGILAVFAVSSLGVYALILAGWASNSKYPFLGGVRASAQLISYELSMTLSVLPVFLWVNGPGGSGSLSLVNVVQAQSGVGLAWDSMWFIVYMPISAIVFLVSLFAETNRLPFDMAEGEADLVGGFHTEYGSLKWGLFFVAEYAHMLVGSGVFVLLFLGGWNPLPGLPLATLAGWLHLTQLPLVLGALSIAIFLGKTLFFIFVFMWVRWTVPRFRYDQVMKLGWQKLLPLAIGNLIVYAAGIAIHDLQLGWLAWLALAVAAIAAGWVALILPEKKNVPLTMAYTVERKPLTLSERFYIPQILAGMKVTFVRIFRPTVTLQYPEERPAIPPGYRGVPTLVMDPNGREKCVSCQLCEFVCPPKAIRITPGAVPADQPERTHVEKAPQEFDIDMLRCIYCGLCQEVCPEEAIFLQNQFSMVGYTRAEMVNNKAKLYELGGTLPDKHFKWDKKKTAEEHGNAH